MTGHDAAGQPIVVSDGPPPHAFDGGDIAAADVWSLAGPPTSVDDGFDPEGGFPIEPPVGGVWWRYVRLPVPDPALDREAQFLEPHGGTPGAGRGMHATATLDVALILSGSIELDTESGSTILAPGDCVVQQGTQHRWRVIGDEPCAYLVALVSPAVPATAPPAPVAAPVVDPGAPFGPRRVVVAPGPDGRSAIVSDGRAPVAVRFGDEAGMVDLWHTHGPLASVVQGGDTPPGDWELEPGLGMAWRFVQLPPAPTAHLHRTQTIDLDVLVAGELDLILPGQDPVQLRPGDCVIQRGTEHAWRNTGTEPAQLVAVMIGVPPT